MPNFKYLYKYIYYKINKHIWREKGLGSWGLVACNITYISCGTHRHGYTRYRLMYIINIIFHK